MRLTQEQTDTLDRDSIRREVAQEIVNELWNVDQCHGHWSKSYCRVCIAACKKKYLGENK